MTTPANSEWFGERLLIQNLRRIRNEISLVLLDDVYRIAQPAIDRVMHNDRIPTATELADIVSEARERLMVGFTELVEKGR